MGLAPDQRVVSGVLHEYPLGPRHAERRRASAAPSLASGGSGAGTHLVEAVRAVDRTIVAREEWHEGLSATLGADRGMHLALTAIPVASPSDPQGSILLCDGSAALAALGLVDQPLAGVELLLAR